MILTATSRIEGIVILRHHDLVTGEAIVGGNVLEERHRAPRRSARRPVRGRDAGYPAPPAQIRTGPFKASGSSLGCRALSSTNGKSLVRPLVAEPQELRLYRRQDCLRHNLLNEGRDAERSCAAIALMASLGTLPSEERRQTFPWLPAYEVPYPVGRL